MADEQQDGLPLWHQSGVNRAGEPFIQLILGTRVIAQQSVEQAREHAMAVLEAAEAAEQDAFLVSWVKDNIGAGEAGAVGMLNEFREWRRARTGKRSGQEVIPPQDKKP